MNLGDLKAFLAVVDFGGFGRAATSLNLAQPAISQQVKRLERDLGTELLVRSTRRVQLSRAGELLVPRARSIISEVERAEDDMRLAASGRAGRVIVGFVGTATYDLLPQVTRSVSDELPKIDLEVYGEQLSPALMEGLLARRIDIAVLRDPTPEPGISFHPLRSELLICALPADDPSANAAHVKLSSLRDHTFVTHPSGHRSAMYDTVMQTCRSAGFIPSRVVEVRETATLVAYVAAGIGVALVPEPVRSLALEAVAYRPISDVVQHTELVLATRSAPPRSPVSEVARVIIATAEGRKTGSLSEGNPRFGRTTLMRKPGDVVRLLDGGERRDDL